jgi:hypothetical protein
MIDRLRKTGKDRQIKIEGEREREAHRYYSEGHVSMGLFGEKLLNNIRHKIMSKTTLDLGFP